MSKIFLINGMKAFGHSKGQLNTTLHEVAKETLSALGHELRETTIDHGYEVEQEIENYLWADVVIYQMPGWWMGEPWIVKNTSMKSSLKVTAACMPAMVAPVLMPTKNMVQAV